VLVALVAYREDDQFPELGARGDLGHEAATAGLPAPVAHQRQQRPVRAHVVVPVHRDDDVFELFVDGLVHGLVDGVVRVAWVPAGDVRAVPGAVDERAVDQLGR